MRGAEPPISGGTSGQINIVFPPLYAIIDAGLVKTSELSFAEMMAESGVEILQYRSKHATSRQLFDICALLAHQWPRLAKHSPRAARFIVNDRADIAALVADKRALFVGLFDGNSDEIRFERSGTFLSRLEKLVEPVVVPDLADGSSGLPEAETARDQELSALVSAADESQDVAPQAAGEALDGAATGPPVALPVPPPSGPEIKRLFAQLQIRPRDGGGIVIDAPAGAAASLAALFEGMAQLLRTSA